MPRHWLIKSEPSAYSYPRLEKERRTAWTGIRNFQARNNLRSMQPGDLALYYHTGDAKEIVGLARVASEPGPDPTAPKGEAQTWAAVDIEPVTALIQPVSLSMIRSHPALKEFPLVKQARLSVAPLTPEQFKLVLSLGKTRLP